MRYQAIPVSALLHILVHTVKKRIPVIQIRVQLMLFGVSQRNLVQLVIAPRNGVDRVVKMLLDHAVTLLLNKFAMQQERQSQLVGQAFC